MDIFLEIAREDKKGFSEDAMELAYWLREIDQSVQTKVPLNIRKLYEKHPEKFQVLYKK